MEDKSTIEGLEHIQILGSLGKGAFGTVLKGNIKETNQLVAIKCINKNYILQVGKKEHVLREK